MNNSNLKKSGAIPSCSVIIKSLNIAPNSSDEASLLQQGYMRRKNIKDILEKEGHDRNRQREKGSA